jgi:glucosamine 6-phosphate synthetase-like amidotransferase/phosphosugar isomerase protein
MFKQTGRISDSLGVLAMAAEARMLIGHCRFATHGDYRQNVNNHPHAADGGWIVHNGMLPEYKRVIEDYDLLPTTECDSEVLGLLIESLAGGLVDRCAKAVEIASPTQRSLFGGEQPLVMMGLWNRPGRMVVVRRGNPLQASSTGEGVYLASLPDAMPGKPTPIKNGGVHLFRAGKATQYASLGK